MGYKASKIWQYTGTGRLKGYSGNLDLDMALMSEEEWKSYYSKTAQGETSDESEESFKYSPGAYKTIRDGIRIREGAGTEYRKKTPSEITANAKANAYKNGTLKRGTKVDVMEVRNDSAGNPWGRIPSGWICLNYEGEPFVKLR